MFDLVPLSNYFCVSLIWIEFDLVELQFDWVRLIMPGHAANQKYCKTDHFVLMLMWKHQYSLHANALLQQYHQFILCLSAYFKNTFK